MTVPSQPTDSAFARRKLRTALVMASLALALFIGFILRTWILGK